MSGGDDLRADWEQAHQRQQDAEGAWRLVQAAYPPESGEVAAAIEEVVAADGRLIAVPAPDVAALSAKLKTIWRPEYGSSEDSGWREAIQADAQRLADEPAWPWRGAHSGG